MTRASGRVNREKRLVDMSSPRAAVSGWEVPSGFVADEQGPYVTFLGDRADDRMNVVMGWCTQNLLARFVLWQETLDDGGEWRRVVLTDSMHGTVHSHRYPRSTGERVGEPLVLKLLTCQADVQSGYIEAQQVMVSNWIVAKQRWQDG